MSDAWNDIQAIKNRQSDIRAKMLERRKLREGLAAELTSSGVAPSIAPANVASSSNSSGDHIVTRALIATNSTISTIKPFQRETVKVTSDPEVEKKLLMVLCDISLDIPSDSKVIAEHTSRLMEREVDLRLIEELLKKFASQKLITIKFTENTGSLIVNSLDLSKLSDITKGQTKKRKKDSDDEEDEEVTAKQARTNASESGDIESLLSMQSTKEREEKKLNEEIQALLVTQTAKEQYLVEKFKSRGGPQLQEFCQCGTREECQRSNPDGANCKRLHFKKIINIHTDESLGDCSFLNTCFHMDSCKEVTNDSNGMMHGPTQLQPQGTMNQNSTQDWFYSFENSENIYSTYGEHKRDILATRYFPQSSNANAGDHMMSGGFITQLSNVSNNAVRPYNSTSRDEEINAYPPSTVPSNCNGAMPLYPVAAVPEAGDVSDRSFPQPSLPVSGNISSQPYPDIIGTGPSITRHYSPMTMPDTASSSTQYSESYPHLQFQYSTVPYSITAAAPSAPAMSSVTADSSSELTPPAYVHYEIDYPPKSLPSTELMKKELSLGKLSSEMSDDGSVQMYPPQWIQCDLRYFDMSTLGKCAVVMADPPWDIHMELPYGTMGDNEMRQLDIPGLQDDGFIFLWVTGRAMELGRECLELWGYKRVDEIIWVKTNQLQRIIRTGRTGHWLNHGKEHCLVGVKGNPKGVNKGMDCDVIVAEVRATSHKPDEIYGIIERLSPGTRKVELFGRPHNVQPNWITLGNQLEGVRLKDPDIVKLFREKYPDGNCMGPPQNR